jgi:hypothetical protein
VLVGAVCAMIAAALTGCGQEADPNAGTNGVGKLTAAKIERKALQAAEGADAVRLSGSVVTKGRTYKLDMRLRGGEEGGAVGRVSTRGSNFEMLRVGDDLYLKADADFWASQEGGEPSKAGSEAASKLDDKYVKVPSTDPAYRQLSGFTDMKLLLDGLLALNGKLTVGDHGSVGGIRTIRVEAGGGAGGALDVSLEGRPFPLRLKRAGGAGVLELADWNTEFTIKAPDRSHIVDYGRQITAGG